MKRGTPDHPKTRQLAVILKLKRFEVVGILESLWHFAANYAKRGDIGRWTNAAIAAAIEWGGDADGLIAALTTSGFLDADPVCRLLVHDWADHADQTVRRSEEVKKQGFASRTPANASCTPADASMPLATENTTSNPASQPRPMPKPRPMPEPKPMPRPGDRQATPAAPVTSPPALGQEGEDSEIAKPPHSGSDNSGSTEQQPRTMPGAANFAMAVGVKLRLPDMGNSPQGKADSETFKRLYQRHILPGHLGPPGQAIKVCYSEAMRIGQDPARTNKAGTFIACVQKRLAEASHDWDG